MATHTRRAKEQEHKMWRKAKLINKGQSFTQELTNTNLSVTVSAVYSVQLLVLYFLHNARMSCLYSFWTFKYSEN